MATQSKQHCPKCGSKKFVTYPVPEYLALSHIVSKVAHCEDCDGPIEQEGLPPSTRRRKKKSA